MENNVNIVKTYMLKIREHMMNLTHEQMVEQKMILDNIMEQIRVDIIKKRNKV